MDCSSPPSLAVRNLLQILWLSQYIWFFLFSHLFSLCLILYILFGTPYYCWSVIPAYFAWIYYDRDAPKTGLRTSDTFRRLKLWRIMGEYFPLKLVKTAELDPSSNYLLAVHPHGVLSLSTIFALATDAAGVYEKFPGLKIYGATLASNFIAPVRREYFLAIGGIDVSFCTLLGILSKPGGGVGAGVVVGGVPEALDNRPGLYKFVLRNRKGFIKIALKSGASLVPVIGFGECDLYQQVDNPKGSLLRKLQDRCKELLGFTLPLFYGNGLLPYRKPVTVVVGTPILVDRVEQPSNEQIDQLHQTYIENLISLFEEHKANYASEETKLEIV